MRTAASTRGNCFLPTDRRSIGSWRVRSAYNRWVDARTLAEISDLFDLEQAALGANVRLLEVIDTVDNGSACGTSDTVVIGFADTTNCADVGFHEEMLCEIFPLSVILSYSWSLLGYMYLRYPSP